MKYWIKIKIGKKVFEPVLLCNGTEVCPALSMPSLSCTLSVPQNLSEIPVEFIYCEGDNYTEVYNDKIFIHKEGGFANAVSAIFAGTKPSSVKFDIFFNDNEEGLCIGFLVSRYKPTKYVVKPEYRRNNDSKNVNNNSERILATSGADFNSAKNVFLANYQLFGELLQRSISGTDTKIVEDWERQISLIQNGSPLNFEFQKHKKNIQTWIKLLYSWGVKQDSCKKYPGCLIMEGRYKTDDMSPIDPEANYDVILPCWTIWIESNGIRTEQNIIYGFVKKI